jgi:hypothetical protein
VQKSPHNGRTLLNPQLFSRALGRAPGPLYPNMLSWRVAAAATARTSPISAGLKIKPTVAIYCA